MSVSLPIGRNTTYAALSQLLSADMNAIQDAIAGELPHFFDDFYELDAFYTGSADGTGSIQGPSAHRMTLATGTAGGNKTRLRTTDEPFGSLFDTPPQFRARVRFSVALTSRIDRVGLMDSSQGELCAFYRDTATGTSLILVVKGGAGLETFDTLWSPALSTWYVLTARVLSTTQVYWAISTTQSATPLASGTVTLASAITSTDNVGFCADVENIAASSRALLLDYISIVTPRQTP